MSKKIQNFNQKPENSWLEPFLLYLVLFMPAVITQNQASGGPDLWNLSFNLLYMAFSIPKILLILYLMAVYTAIPFSAYGLETFSLKNILKAFLLALFLIGAAITVMLIVTILLPPGLKNLITPNYSLARGPFPLWLVPVIFATCLITGYYEELFFRAYLITRFERLNIRPYILLLVVSLLFGIGHLYQGALGVIVTTIIGFLLGIMFMKYRNLHLNALVHAFYNFFIIMLWALPWDKWLQDYPPGLLPFSG